MGNTAIVELADSRELDELFKLNASETEPEGEEDQDEDEDDEGIQPEEVPHG